MATRRQTATTQDWTPLTFTHNTLNETYCSLYKLFTKSRRFVSRHRRHLAINQSTHMLIDRIFFIVPKLVPRPLNDRIKTALPSPQFHCVETDFPHRMSPRLWRSCTMRDSLISKGALAVFKKIIELYF